VEAIQQAVVTQPAAPNASTANANTGTDVAKATNASPPPASDAERAALEKRAAEAERKLKEEQQNEAENETTAAPAPAATVVTPPAPEPPKETESEPPVAPGSTCVIVWVSSTTGGPAGGGLRVTVVEEPDSGSAAMYNGHTGPKGRFRACGLTPGHQVRVTVFGPRGAPLGSKMQVLKAGLNIVQIQVNREPGGMQQSDTDNSMPMRKRGPRRLRPRAFFVTIEKPRAILLSYGFVSDVRFAS
jgi:hypothetical protein